MMGSGRGQFLYRRIGGEARTKSERVVGKSGSRKNPTNSRFRGFLLPGHEATDGKREALPEKVLGRCGNTSRFRDGVVQSTDTASGPEGRFCYRILATRPPHSVTSTKRFVGAPQ